MRPTGGVKGKGWLCTAPGVIERLALSGTIYGGWSTTEGSLMEFRLNERNIIDLGQQRRGYFDLYGRWHGTKLMIDDRGRYSSPFSSGVKIEHASVALDWGLLGFQDHVRKRDEFPPRSMTRGNRPTEATLSLFLTYRPCGWGIRRSHVPARASICAVPSPEPAAKWIVPPYVGRDRKASWREIAITPVTRYNFRQSDRVVRVSKGVMARPESKNYGGCLVATGTSGSEVRG